MLCVLYSIGSLVCGHPDCSCCQRKNKQNSLCGKDCTVSIPGFGNGAVYTGAVDSGTDLVRLDGTQAEKAIHD